MSPNVLKTYCREPCTPFFSIPYINAIQIFKRENDNRNGFKNVEVLVVNLTYRNMGLQNHRQNISYDQCIDELVEYLWNFYLRSFGGFLGWAHIAYSLKTN